jgi:hypothetical protein
MSASRYGAPAPSGPPMPVKEREQQAMADVTYIPVRAVQAPPAIPTAATLREQMQARADELRADIAALEGKRDELALIERMLEVK